MDIKTYHIIFKGEIVEGAEIETVKKKLGNYLQKNISKIDYLFSGKKVILKKNASLQACKKIKKAFHDAGAICLIIKSTKMNPVSRPTIPRQQTEIKKENSSPPPRPPQSGITKGENQKVLRAKHPNAGNKTSKKLLICVGAVFGIAIIGILIAIAIPNFISYRNRAHIASINTELQKIKDAQTRYYSNYQHYTDSLAALNIYITAPDIKIQILSADENCFQVKGTHLEAGVESWLDCNSTNLNTISTMLDSPDGIEDTADYDEIDSSPDKPLFSSSEGGFEVMFPDEPTYKMQAVNTPAGKIDLHFYMVETKEYACIVGYSDYPVALMEQADHNTLLDGAANGAVNNINARIEYQEDISLEGYYGREISFTIKKSFKMPKGGNGKARFYIADNRLYQILKIGTNVISDSTTDNYLESFKILY
jgi:Tfp pilus assembly protein PilE